MFLGSDVGNTARFTMYEELSHWPPKLGVFSLNHYQVRPFSVFFGGGGGATFATNCLSHLKGLRKFIGDCDKQGKRHFEHTESFVCGASCKSKMANG